VQWQNQLKTPQKHPVLRQKATQRVWVLDAKISACRAKNTSKIGQSWLPKASSAPKTYEKQHFHRFWG
jgi:hypothetical protein